MAKSLAIAYAMKKKSKKMSEGQGSHEPMDASAEDGGVDMVHRILKKCYAEGGSVDNGGDEHEDQLADHDDADFDYGAEHAEPMSHMESGDDSGDDIGDHRESEDREDMVGRILKMKKMKDKNPKPA